MPVAYTPLSSEKYLIQNDDQPVVTPSQDRNWAAIQALFKFGMACGLIVLVRSQVDNFPLLFEWSDAILKPLAF